MLAYPSRRRLPAGGHDAFTLIELLVVVSIIALLISILLPSLKNAREQAKTVVCASTLRGLSSSNAIYHGMFNDWLAGAPGTSGSALLRHPDRDGWDSNDTYLEVSGSYLTVNHLQVWDWATPLDLVESYPSSRPDYYKLLFERYRCPNNRFVARPVVGGASAGPDWPTVQAPSYYTVRNMLYWPSSSSSAPYSAAQATDKMGEGEGLSWTLPRSFAPNLARLGNPSRKIFLTDGSRWTRPDTGAIDYDIPWDARMGGAFSTGGAPLHTDYLRDFFLSSSADTVRIAPITYRHKKTSQVGVVTSFYDGHAAYLSEAESRHPDYWWPRGTKVHVTQELNFPAQLLVIPYHENLYYTVQ